MVTGSRYLKRENASLLFAALNEQYDLAVANDEPMYLIHGACPSGADALAEDWYWHKMDDGARHLYIVRYEADWDTFGKYAGPRRNKQMVDTKPDIVLAFPLGDSKGTRGTIRMAREAGLEVRILNDEV